MDFKELTEALAVKRELKLLGEVTLEKQEVLCTAIELMARESDEPITLLIDSIGGSGQCGFHIHDAIRFSRAPVDALVSGKAKSAAFVVLQACRVRRAYPHAMLMFHEGRLEQALCDPQASRTWKQFRARYKKFFQLLSRRSGQPLDKIIDWSRDDADFMATEGLSFGFIDEILKPSPLPDRQ